MKLSKFAQNSLALALVLSINAKADIVHNDDVIITFSACVGNDCVNGENFGFDTIRLKENNLRIGFTDTSNSGSFPSNDWTLIANDSANGGANYFSIYDVTGSKTPFKVEAGARNNALIVEADGDVGIGTLNPAVDLEVVTGNTPTMRLNQDGSNGFTPQTWDVAGNEANFFIRDVTNGSKLSFRIRPGAPESSIDIAADGDVGIGTSTPDGKLDVSGTGVVKAYFTSSDNNPVQIRMKTNSTNKRFLAKDGADNTQSQIIFLDNEIKFAGPTDSTNLFATFNSTGLTVNGSISTTVSGQVHPDYVFEPDYKLMPLIELKKFLSENKHLPEIPSASDVMKNGINLTEFQILLLKKIEELTLHTIRQEETINTLKNNLTNMTK